MYYSREAMKKKKMTTTRAEDAKALIEYQLAAGIDKLNVVNQLAINHVAVAVEF